MTVIGSASINIRADDKYFEPDVRRAVAKIKDLRIALKVDADMSAANKKLRDLRYRMSKNEVQIKIRANDASFEADVRAAVRKIKNVQIDLKADVDVAKASKKIRDLRYRITSKDAVLKIDANLAKAEEKMRKFLEKFINTEVNIHAKAHTGAAHTALNDLQTRYGQNVNFTATANTRVANAQLAHAARTRRAKILAFIDNDSKKALQGLFNTLTGTLPFDKIKSSLSGVAANFEGVATKGALVLTTILAIGGAALTAGANLLAIGGDISQVVGAAAMLPAAMIAFGTTIAANKMAWKGFGEALSSDPEKAAAAMAKLPPQAQLAADGIRGLGSQIQKATQIETWVALESTLQDMVQTLFPEMLAGFKNIGSSLGSLEGAGLRGIQDAFDGGVLEEILGNVAGMLVNMGAGIADFIQGFATLASVGATYLPAFGTSVADAGTKFGEFIKKADEAGKINQWIETASRRFQELGSVVGSTVSIMSGLTAAARMSGASGLTDLADGLRNVADIVNTEPFQSRLVAILEGARAGTDRLGEGLGTLTELFGRSADSIGSFLELAGQIAGITFENITALFSGTGLGSGLYAALQGLKTAMGDLGPGFSDLGSAIGDLGEIAGELFVSMAPGLNMLAETIAGVVGGLKDGVLDAMPVLNEFMQAILSIASGPLIALAEGIGNMLSTFSELPGVVQTVIMSLGLFIALKAKFGGFFTGLSTGLRDQNTLMGATWGDMRARASTSADSIGRAFRVAGTGLGQSIQNGARVATGGFSNLGTNLANLGSSSLRTIQSTATGMQRIASGALSQVGALSKGAMGAMGGPWGLAIAGATMALGAYAQEQAKSKARVDELTTSLQAQGGEWSKASQDMLATNMLDGATSGWDDFFRGFIMQSKSVEESFDILGTSATDVSKVLSDSDSREKYLKGWDAISDALNHNKPITEEMAKAVGTTTERLAQLDGTSVGHLTTEIEGVAEEAAKAEAEAQKLADTFGTSTIHAQKLSANYKTLEDQTSSVSDKFSALKSNMDILNGGTMTAATASREYHQSLADTAESLTEISQRGGVVMTSLYSTKDGFDMASQAGRDLHSSLGDSADAILLQATTAFDVARKGGASMEEAQAAAANSMAQPMEAFRASLAGFGFLPEQIEGIVSAFGLVPEQVTTALYADGDQAIMEAARTQLMIEAYADGKYDAVLGALPTSAKEAIGEAMGMTEEFTNGEYEAILSAFDDTPGGREAAMAALATFDGTDWEAFLIANNLIPDEISKANEAAQGLVPEKSLDIVANDLASVPLAEVDAWQVGDKSINLNADDNISAMLHQINTSPLMDKGSELTAEDLVTKMVNDLNAKELNGKMTEFEVNDLVSTTMAEINSKSIDGKTVEFTANDLASMVIANINDTTVTDKDVLVKVSDSASSILGTINEYEVGDKSMALSATDNISSVITQINSSSLMDKGSELSTTDLVSQTIRDINAQQLDGKLTEMQANDLVSATMEHINAYNLDDKATNFTATDLASLVLEQINATGLNSKEVVVATNDLATGVLTGVNEFYVGDKNLNLSATDTVTSVLGQVNSSPLMDKDSQLTTDDLVTQVVNNVNATQLNGKLNKLETQDLVSATLAKVNAASLDGKANTLTTQDLVSMVVQNVNNKGMFDKANVLNTTDNVSPVINSINNSVLRDKSNVVTTTLKTLREGIPQANGGMFDGAGSIVMAKGGIIKGAVQAFANGGINRGAQSAIKAFAGGGIENHTAQIARGAWPVRVWAEPETGGEAYIPLSKNKRKRSLDILKEVMAEFGLGHLTHSFADGGIMPATQSPTVVSQRYAASAPSGSAKSFSSAVQATATPIIVQVNPSAPLNEKQVGEAAARELYWQITNQ